MTTNLVRQTGAALALPGDVVKLKQNIPAEGKLPTGPVISLHKGKADMTAVGKGVDLRGGRLDEVIVNVWWTT